MTAGLNTLISAALLLGGGKENQVSHNFAMWETVGGRACPLGWDHCSQPVFENIATGEHDYGDRGGPGHDDCVRNCRHGMEAPPADEKDIFLRGKK